MFKLTFVLLLLAPCCFAQCTTQSCDTESPDTQMKVIMQRLDELSLENNKLKTTLEMTNQEFRSTIEGLETANDEFRTTNAELRKDITQIQMTSTELQTTNEQLQTTVANLQMNVTQLQATATASAAAYFSVAANSTEDYVYTTIKFPVTHTNVVPAGSTGGWDAYFNEFTCPITGDYMFVVTLYKPDADSYNDFAAALTRTSLSGYSTRITALSNYKDSSVSGNIVFSSTMQAIMPCRAGEKVWVQARCSGCRLYDDVYHRNTFTGLKL